MIHPTQRLRAIPLLLAALLAASCQAGPLTPPAAPGPTSHELVVSFQPGTPEAERQALRHAAGVTTATAILDDTELWKLGSAVSESALARLQQRREAIAFVHVNAPHALTRYFGSFAVSEDPAEATPADADTTDPLADEQWYLQASRFDQAWGRSKGRGVTVAVIDSGIDPDHPDLKANLLPMIDVLAELGRTDAFDGEDYTGRDGNGHGTHVAGLIAAVAHNGEGISGAAPEATILPVKVTNARGQTDDVTVARGIVTAVDAGARVINLSLGGPEPSQVLLKAINYAFSQNVLVVIAAGNDAKAVHYPAAFGGVLSVGALTDDDTLASYSNRGENLVMVAPGGGHPNRSEGRGMLSTTPGYACYATEREGVSLSYSALAGTSMAAPLVTAAAALILSLEPNLSPLQVRTRLAASANDLGVAGWDAFFGFGALDVDKALSDGARP